MPTQLLLSNQVLLQEKAVFSAGEMVAVMVIQEGEGELKLCEVSGCQHTHPEKILMALFLEL